MPAPAAIGTGFRILGVVFDFMFTYEFHSFFQRKFPGFVRNFIPAEFVIPVLIIFILINLLWIIEITYKILLKVIFTASQHFSYLIAGGFAKPCVSILLHSVVGIFS